MVIRNFGWDLPGSPVVRNLPCKAGDMDLTPGQETKIRHAGKQLGPHVTATKARVLQQESLFATKIPCDAMKVLHAATKM